MESCIKFSNILTGKIIFLIDNLENKIEKIATLTKRVTIF